MYPRHVINNCADFPIHHGQFLTLIAFYNLTADMPMHMHMGQHMMAESYALPAKCEWDE